MMEEVYTVWGRVKHSAVGYTVVYWKRCIQYGVGLNIAWRGIQSYDGRGVYSMGEG